MVSSNQQRLRTTCELLDGRQFVADLAIHDLAQGGVFGGEFLQRFDQGSCATSELFNPAGDDIDEDIRIVDDRERGFQVFVSHGGVG